MKIITEGEPKSSLVFWLDDEWLYFIKKNAGINHLLKV